MYQIINAFTLVKKLYFYYSDNDTISQLSGSEYFIHKYKLSLNFSHTKWCIERLMFVCSN